VFNKNLFVKKEEPVIRIPDDSDIVIVSDMFASEYAGGAELTTEALIDACHLNVFKLNSSHVSLDLLAQGSNKHWIFCNFSQMNKDLIPTIVANVDYSIIEYDYKYCAYRSPEKHEAATGEKCDCHEQMHGKLISAFYYGSTSLWWMSTRQMEIYHEKFPFLKSKFNVVLSSMFSSKFFDTVSNLREKYENKKEDKWVIIGSTSWIKGVNESKSYCEKNNLNYEIVAGVSHNQVLEEMASSKGFVFLPLGGDTCPRTVIEAKLLGCEIKVNENVQHAEEEWFNNSVTEIEDYLKSRPGYFWKFIESVINSVPTISGYTTTLNCIDQNYPFVESIKSMLGFCDQVVVVDGGSKDGTWEKIVELANSEEKLVIHQNNRDWNDSRFAVFDGLQKAFARSLCTGDMCWQQDSDEVVNEKCYEKVKELAKNLTKSIDLVALPVIEYWGSEGKVRIDVNPWKWRLSRNKDYITHGIPGNLRTYDDEGKLHALPGTDGCDYIDSETFDYINCANFYNDEIHNVRVAALNSDINKDAGKFVDAYENWFNNVVNQLPGVHHFSWFDLGRKIRTYKNYWSKHWQSLYNVEQEDTPENNMFFDKSWSDVTEDEIDDLATRLQSEMGGWIFHKKIDWDRKTPFIDCEIRYPDVMSSWIQNISNSE